jgi:hypothetical protein
VRHVVALALSEIGRTSSRANEHVAAALAVTTLAPGMPKTACALCNLQTAAAPPCARCRAPTPVCAHCAPAWRAYGGLCAACARRAPRGGTDGAPHDYY